MNAITKILREERIGRQRLILGDCLDVLPLLGRFDAVVTDPPYGIGLDKGMRGAGYCGKTGKPRAPRHHAGEWDKQRPSREAFDLMLAMSDRAVIWGGQFFADMLPPQGKWLWWDKLQTMPSYGDGELAWTSIPGKAAKKFTHSLNGMIARREIGQHPTQKPVALMEWCLGFLPGAQTILDPFMGSGTTLIACERLGRQGVGIERDPAHFETACRRLDEATRQGALFGGDE
jgi:DNA modification methylase